MPRRVPDAFKSAREAEGQNNIRIGSETMPILLSYAAVREAAKNWQTYSSDAPFRVPIPSEEGQRSVRQIPIETDPPAHKKYRDLIAPFFRRPMTPDYNDTIDELVRSAILACAAKDRFDAVRDFALPVQSRALAFLLGMPESAATIWIEWGTHVLYDGADSVRKGADLESYLLQMIAAATSEQDPTNFFGALNAFKLDDRPLTEAEKLGIANLVFAGGRDTVINTIAFLMAHFANHPEDLEQVARSPKRVNLAVEESIRVVSPLTHIGRVCEHGSSSSDAHEKGRISLCWAAANYDPSVFADPEQVDLARSPNPHIGFGSGHHTCLGAPQARAILRSVIRNVADLNARLNLLEAVPNLETIGEFQRQVGYERLILSMALEGAL